MPASRVRGCCRQWSSCHSGRAPGTAWWQCQLSAERGGCSECPPEAVRAGSPDPDLRGSWQLCGNSRGPRALRGAPHVGAAVESVLSANAPLSPQRQSLSCSRWPGGRLVARRRVRARRPRSRRVRAVGTSADAAGRTQGSGCLCLTGIRQTATKSGCVHTRRAGADRRVTSGIRRQVGRACAAQVNPGLVGTPAEQTRPRGRFPRHLPSPTPGDHPRTCALPGAAGVTRRHL